MSATPQSQRHRHIRNTTKSTAPPCHRHHHVSGTATSLPRSHLHLLRPRGLRLLLVPHDGGRADGRGPRLLRLRAGMSEQPAVAAAVHAVASRRAALRVQHGGSGHLLQKVRRRSQQIRRLALVACRMRQRMPAGAIRANTNKEKTA